MGCEKESSDGRAGVDIGGRSDPDVGPFRVPVGLRAFARVLGVDERGVRLVLTFPGRVESLDVGLDACVVGGYPGPFGGLLV